jgi:hypothetical protein
VKTLAKSVDHIRRTWIWIPTPEKERDTEKYYFAGDMKYDE